MRSVPTGVSLMFAALAASSVVPSATALGTAPARAQVPADSLRAEIERLRARMDSLAALVDSLRAAGQEEEAGDALVELRAAARAAAGEPAARDTAATPEEAQFAGRQRSLQALNPEISVTGDVFGHMNTDHADEQNFVPREFEISLQSTLDPFSRAKVFLSHHAEGPELIPFGDHEEEEGEEGEEEGEEHEEHGAAGLGVEEGYVEWVGLPGGFNLKVGKFFHRFGTLNRWHAHALPFQSRSLPHLAILGEEAYAQTGASVTWLLPFRALGAWEVTGEVARSSHEPLFGESNDVSFLGHVNAFWQLGNSTDLDLGLSWTHGEYADEEQEFGRDLYGAEAAFTWRPPAQARYRGFGLRGGVMVLDGLVPPEEDPGAPLPPEPEEEPERAFGAWSAAEVRLSERWLAGARFDWTENPAEPEETAWLVSPTVTWWQSEWVRLRAEYDLLGRSFLDEHEGRLWLQITFAMGPHKHETY